MPPLGVPGDALALDRHAPSSSWLGCISHAAGENSADLVGSERVRRHPHRRARSGPPSGVSRGPRACWVRVPILNHSAD